MRTFMISLIGLLLLVMTGCDFGDRAGTDTPGKEAANPGGPPNIVFILADDLGYGDLGSYGSSRARTPHLDRMAAEGLKFTSFYAFPSCSPSRAALLTGSYPLRAGVPRVLGPPGPAWTADLQYGLHPDEVILPEVLKAVGYCTGMVGKWHLGHFAETMPGRQGFDEFFGLPYSNDMLPAAGYPDLPLLDGADTVDTNPDQRFLTERYTDRALDFVDRHRDTTFFLYLAHSMPHVPIFTSEDFDGRSGQGVYADVVEELDHSVGRLRARLAEHGLTDNTLIVFTSDNGPWLTYGNHAGSAGPFREGKGTTWEGGMRVPAIACWPAGIPAGRVTHEAVALIDWLPTLRSIAGAEDPGPVRDGIDVRPLLTGATEALPERTLGYYSSGELQAVRRGAWKLHLPHNYRSVSRVANDGQRGDYTYDPTTELALYHLGHDPGERYNVAADHPALVDELRAAAQALAADVSTGRRPSFYETPSGR